MKNIVKRHLPFRADLNKMMMSMSVGPFCSLDQDVDSKDWRTGAVVAIKMDENERECEQAYPFKLSIYQSCVFNM